MTALFILLALVSGSGFAYWAPKPMKECKSYCVINVDGTEECYNPCY